MNCSPFTFGQVDPFIAVYLALRQIQSKTSHKAEPWVILNPNKWESIRQIQDDTGSLILGDPETNQTNTIWGRAVVLDPTVPADQFRIVMV